ncbi:MAG: alanine racemase, partial [Atribacterota bacterium]
NDPIYTRKQYGLFSQTVQSFCQYTGLSPDSLEKHCCNSAGFLFFPPYHGQMIRLGIALFGVSPTLDPQDVRSRGLRPVMSIKSRIKHLKTLPPDFCVGYGSTWVTRRETRIAVIPIGYAQGLFRSLSNHCDVLVRGKRAKCIGTISMDQIMVDITDIPGVEKGDLVTILGQDGNDEIRAEELAVRANTIPHEILCSFVRIKNRITV